MTRRARLDIGAPRGERLARMLADIIGGGDGLEITLVVVMVGGSLAVRGWFHSLDKRVALLEQRLDPPPDRSAVHTRAS